MKVSLKDKVDIYENFLKRIASIDVEKECVEALANAPDKEYDRAYALGAVSQAFKFAVSDARYALNCGAKK